METTVVQRVVRVLIVDDHELLRDGLRQLLSRQPGLEVCGEAGDIRSGREQVKELGPDLAIVDLSLLDDSGLDLIKWIVETHEQTRVIVYTMHDERVYGERAVRAGASGFVNKQLSARTILTAISNVLAGGSFFGDELTSRLMRRATSRSGNSANADGSIVGPLSDRELQVFTLIGLGYSTSEIAERLHISPNTVGTHRERVKVKLKLQSSNELHRQATLWAAENQ